MHFQIMYVIVTTASVRENGITFNQVFHRCAKKMGAFENAFPFRSSLKYLAHFKRAILKIEFVTLKRNHRPRCATMLWLELYDFGCAGKRGLLLEFCEWETIFPFGWKFWTKFRREMDFCAENLTDWIKTNWKKLLLYHTIFKAIDNTVHFWTNLELAQFEVTVMMETAHRCARVIPCDLVCVWRRTFSPSTIRPSFSLKKKRHDTGHRTAMPNAT